MLNFISALEDIKCLRGLTHSAISVDYNISLDTLVWAKDVKILANITLIGIFCLCFLLQDFFQNIKKGTLNYINVYFVYKID